MSHRQHAQQEAALEDVWGFIDGDTQFTDAAFYLLYQDGMAISFYRALSHAFQHGQLFAAGMVGVVARHFVRKRVAARKS